MSLIPCTGCEDPLVCAAQQECGERRRARKRASYAANREKVLAARAAYREANRDAIRERNRAYERNKRARHCTACGEQLATHSITGLCGWCIEERELGIGAWAPGEEQTA